jgi:hypothetical protein
VLLQEGILEVGPEDVVAVLAYALGGAVPSNTISQPVGVCRDFAHRGIALLERMIADPNPLLRGWAGYFGFSQWRELASLDGWTRRRLRCVIWVQWKTRGRRYSIVGPADPPSATTQAVRAGDG